MRKLIDIITEANRPPMRTPMDSADWVRRARQKDQPQPEPQPDPPAPTQPASIQDAMRSFIDEIEKRAGRLNLVPHVIFSLAKQDVTATGGMGGPPRDYSDNKTGQYKIKRYFNGNYNAGITIVEKDNVIVGGILIYDVK